MNSPVMHDAFPTQYEPLLTNEEYPIPETP